MTPRIYWDRPSAPREEEKKDDAEEPKSDFQEARQDEGRRGEAPQEEEEAPV